MEYISASSVSESDPGGSAELTVWNKLKRCFETDEQGVLYHQYPIIEKGGNRFDQKPDFVLLHEAFGLVILECKGYTIDQIERIEGDKWRLQNMTQGTASPLEQARNQGFHLLSYFQREQQLRTDAGHCCVSMNPIVVLPNIDRAEWDARGFDGPSAPRIIAGDELGPVTLRNRLASLHTHGSLDDTEYATARDVLSCGQVISGSHGQPPANPQTKSEQYETVTSGIRGFDENQQKIGLQIPPGPQQIRGIAGSGKTVLLAMKAARMLVDPQDWETVDDACPRIALTFSTKSLYSHITELVERFYQRFSGQPLCEAEIELDIIHGWGGPHSGDGVYYRIANATPGATYRTYDQAARAFPDAEDKQEAVAQEVRLTGEIPALWDAILIDEAQDFGPEFLNLCREALTDANRLIWAYDEAQDLGSLEAPSPKNVFGTDDDGEPLLDLSGTYKNGPQKTYIMRKSYRAPRSVVLAAHVLGMGLKREEGPVQTITRQDGWHNLGYEIDADFRKTGSEAVLSRPTENSPHPLQGVVDADSLLSHRSFATKEDELEWVADQIREDIYAEGLEPEQILVISLSGQKIEGKQSKTYVRETLGEYLSQHGIELNHTWEASNKSFAEPGAVTLARINRAKGNEAAAVYVVGVDSTTEEGWRGEPVQRRNQLFVALTRTRAWCSITGTTPTAPIHDEIEATLNEVQQDDPQITFEVPNSRDVHELETDTENLVNATLDDFPEKSI